MKKNFIIKIFTILFISTILILICNHKVMATNFDEENNTLTDTLNSETKIMEYDAITNETREVDMQELREVLKQQNKSYGQNNFSIPSIAPQNLKRSFVDKSFSLLTNREGSLNKVLNTEVRPYLTTCRITCTGPNLGITVANGTASVIGLNLAFTAAHCVFDESNNAILKNWTIYPGYNNKMFEEVSTGWSKVYYSDNWMKNHNSADDWAILVLNNNIGNFTGAYGISYYPSYSGLNNLNVSLLGYPCDKDQGFDVYASYQFESTGTITSVNNDRFLYSSYSCNGFSGGPVINRNDPEYILGINIGTDRNNAYAVRITQYLYDLILSLR